MNVDFEFIDHQLKVFEKREEGKNEILMTSGTGGGKTWFGARYIILEAITAPKEIFHISLAISPTAVMANTTIIPEINKVLSIIGFVDGKDYAYNGSRKEYIFKKNNAVIYVAGAENHNRIQGIHPHFIWCDECGLYNEAAWKTIEQRASFHDAFLLGTSTPYNWGYYKTKVDQAESGENPDSYAFRVPSIANPHYPIKIYNRRKKLWPKWKFDMMYNGMFTSPKGLIYQTFRDCIVPYFDIPKNWFKWGAIDYGSVHPTAILWFAKCPKTGITYVYDEWIFSDKKVSDIHNAIKNRRHKYYADTSGKQITAELNYLGGNVENAIKDVEPGIILVDSMLKDGKLKIMENCIALQQEGYAYAWQLDKNDKPTMKPVKEKDDGMDALRYGIMSHLGNRPSKTSYAGDARLKRTDNLFSGFL
jgi:PBSX family phage terminase large subunit